MIGLRTVAVLCLAVLPGFAQEINPKDPAVIADGVNRSHAVVIGTFKAGFHFPWFDGWHYAGSIGVSEVLNGYNAPTSTIPMRWKERYRTCFICERMSRFDGVKGIWFLTKVNGAWELAGTKLWCGGPLGLDSKDDVLKAVRRNN